MWRDEKIPKRAVDGEWRLRSRFLGEKRRRNESSECIFLPEDKAHLSAFSETLRSSSSVLKTLRTLKRDLLDTA